MTQRKPQGVPFESWVDQLIREAQERGEFDNLAGTGKPLPGIDRPLAEDWWVHQKIREEELPSDALLPPALQLRKELAALPDDVRHLRDEAAVRARVRDVNERVAAWIRNPSGPVLPLAPANMEAIVAGWRAAQPDPPPAPSSTPAPPGPRDAAPVRRRRRWWWPWARTGR